MNLLFASEIEDPKDWLPVLERALPQDRVFIEPREDIDIALVATPPAGTFAKLKRLKLVQSMWMGVERLLEDPAVPKDVPLARLVDPGMVGAMAETVLLHTLDWHRHLYRYRAQQRERRWHRFRQYLASDRTVGLLGLGELGTVAARTLRGFGFHVAGWSRRPKQLEGIECFTDLHAMARKCDVLVCLLPLTPETKHVLDRRLFDSMKKGGALVNVARGGHLVPADLIAALDAGQLAHAYLDVFEPEPLPASDPLWSHPGVTITPHAAALSEPRTAAKKIVENVERVRRGEAPLNLVDRAAGY